MTPRQKKITATVTSTVIASLIVAALLGAGRHEQAQDARDAKHDSTLVSHDGRLGRLEDEAKRLDSANAASVRRLDSANAANVKRILRAICYRNPHPACDQ